MYIIYVLHASRRRMRRWVGVVSWAYGDISAGYNIAYNMIYYNKRYYGYMRKY